MIDKETLLEKIKNGETVWFMSPNRVIEVPLLKENRPEIRYGTMLYVQIDNCNPIYRCKFKLDNIYETKEDAEWELEFGNITRTDKLELPTWESINDGCDHDIPFVDSKRGKWQFLIRDCEIILFDFSILNRDKHWEELNKENYINACRLCKKIFLGEEVD